MSKGRGFLNQNPYRSSKLVKRHRATKPEPKPCKGRSDGKKESSKVEWEQPKEVRLF
jgi:hypothetical protein